MKMMRTARRTTTRATQTTRTIYYKYIMWGIKLKGLRRQADLSYSHKAMRTMVRTARMTTSRMTTTRATWTTRTIYYKYIMWGIKLKGLRRQADLSYSHKAMMTMVRTPRMTTSRMTTTRATWITRTIYYKYIMWGIKLKGFVRQVDLSYSQG